MTVLIQRWLPRRREAPFKTQRKSSVTCLFRSVEPTVLKRIACSVCPVEDVASATLFGLEFPSGFSFPSSIHIILSGYLFDHVTCFSSSVRRRDFCALKWNHQMSRKMRRGPSCQAIQEGWSEHPSQMGMGEAKSVPPLIRNSGAGSQRTHLRDNRIIFVQHLN